MKSPVISNINQFKMGDVPALKFEIADNNDDYYVKATMDSLFITCGTDGMTLRFEPNGTSLYGGIGPLGLCESIAANHTHKNAEHPYEVYEDMYKQMTFYINTETLEMIQDMADMLYE